MSSQNNTPCSNKRPEKITGIIHKLEIITNEDSFFNQNAFRSNALSSLSLSFSLCIIASCPASRYWTVFITPFQQRILPLSLSHLYNYYHCLCTIQHGFFISIQA